MASVKLTKVKKVYDNNVVAVHDFVVVDLLDFRQFYTCHIMILLFTA